MIFTATIAGDRALVMDLISQGVRVDARDGLGRTPLMDACKKGDVDMVKFLVDCGANVNSKDMYGETPLMAACLTSNFLTDRGRAVINYGHFEVIVFLVEHGANVDQVDRLDQTALDIVRDAEISDYLRQHVHRRHRRRDV